MEKEEESMNIVQLNSKRLLIFAAIVIAKPGHRLLLATGARPFGRRRARTRGRERGSPAVAGGAFGSEAETALDPRFDESERIVECRDAFAEEFLAKELRLFVVQGRCRD